VKDVFVTVGVAIVLAIAFMYILLSLAFSGWGITFHSRLPRLRETS
jgi:hypothetical protein